ncbi:hypothetical protein ACFL43_06235, partial [Thermodesulfobacteriota bacterium]
AIETVWAVIVAPGATGTADAVTGLPEVTLKNTGSGSYAVTYHKFFEAGSYAIAVFARDVNGNISLPRQTTVYQETAVDCPAASLSGGETAQTRLLRSFRDRLLRSTPFGRRLVQLFYRHAPQLSTILQDDPQLFADCSAALAAVMPSIAAAMATNRLPAMAPGAVREAMNCLTAIAQQADADLQQAIIYLHKMLNLLK